MQNNDASLLFLYFLYHYYNIFKIPTMFGGLWGWGKWIIPLWDVCHWEWEYRANGPEPYQIYEIGWTGKYGRNKIYH